MGGGGQKNGSETGDFADSWMKRFREGFCLENAGTTLFLGLGKSSQKDRETAQSKVKTARVGGSSQESSVRRKEGVGGDSEGKKLRRLERRKEQHDELPTVLFYRPPRGNRRARAVRGKLEAKCGRSEWR